jgi:hypothetical protein
MMKKDLLTGELFEPRRSNQNFANPQNRIKYYNEKAKKQRQKIAYINKPLQKNLSILDELCSNKNEAVFHKQYLLGKGFSFGVFTHYDSYQDKNYRACYQYLIIPFTNEQIKIVRK